MPYEVTGHEIAPSEVSVSNGWCDIAPRRTTKPNLNVATNVAAYGTTTKASKPVSARKEIIKASRMPLLPQNETKVVIRIRGGLNIAKTGHVEIVQAIQEAAGLETTQCDGDTICPNLKQNIMVVSSPLPENVHGYLKIQSITIAGQTYEASSYQTAPDDTCKGIQRELGIPIGQQRSQEPLPHTREPRPLHLGGALRTPGRSQQLGPASQGDNGMPGLRNGGDAAHKPRAAEGPISGQLQFNVESLKKGHDRLVEAVDGLTSRVQVMEKGFGARIVALERTVFTHSTTPVNPPAYPMVRWNSATSDIVTPKTAVKSATKVESKNGEGK
ncbi:hypothetical protein HPB49_014006 [Dermacentor silvarum]|uniref:Uncharacterized protein n=1 Tax=Dermacentor silvarum TaxID=543639 RepID=A0ACB8DDS0_DERSI|nr:hypothetical protein HPB49_014006 [Dermacentor silvarum]